MALVLVRRPASYLILGIRNRGQPNQETYYAIIELRDNINIRPFNLEQAFNVELRACLNDIYYNYLEGTNTNDGWDGLTWDCTFSPARDDYIDEFLLK